DKLTLVLFRLITSFGDGSVPQSRLELRTRCHCLFGLDGRTELPHRLVCWHGFSPIDTDTIINNFHDLPSYFSTVSKSVSMKGKQLIILNRSLGQFASLLAVWSFINSMPVMSNRIIVTLSAWYRDLPFANYVYDAPGV